MFNGHTFRLYTTPKSWLQAKTYCEERDGHLATITNAEITTILQPFLSPYASYNMGFAWIGGSRNAGEYDWTWVTGEEWSYTNWYTGCPGRTSINDGAGVAINLYDSTWYDLQSVYGYYFICEWVTKLLRKI